jgi:predicted nuclease with TOPRIM domain
MSELDAGGRIRLYMELTDTPDLSDEMISDPRFKSEEWPRSMYALSRADMRAVLAELEHLREVRDGFAEKLLDLDSTNVKILALAAEARAAIASSSEESERLKRVLESVKASLATRDGEYKKLKKDYDKLEWMMEELRK